MGEGKSYILVRMSEELTKKVDSVCREYGISRAQLVKTLLIRYLDQVSLRRER